MLNLMPLLDADKIQDLERFGEDGCSLVRLIEESFDIQFTADDLIEATTVGKLKGCISKKLRGEPERCLTAIVFYRLRRILVDLLFIPRADIRPNTKLERLFSWSQRVSQWKALGTQSELVLPRLAHPGWLVGAVLLISVATSWFFARSFGEIPAALATLFGWIFSFVCLLWLTRPIARAFPKSCSTFGELAKVTVARNHAMLSSEAARCSSGELFFVLRQLIAVEIGCDVDDIREETSFPEGLKID